LAEILRVVPLDLAEWMIVIVLGSLPALRSTRQSSQGQVSGRR
jgi:hypothetical protein